MKAMESMVVVWGGLWAVNADFGAEALRLAEFAEDTENGLRFASYVSRFLTQVRTIRSKNALLLRGRGATGSRPVLGCFWRTRMPTGSSGVHVRRADFKAMISKKPVSDRHARRRQSSKCIDGV